MLKTRPLTFVSCLLIKAGYKSSSNTWSWIPATLIIPTIYVLPCGDHMAAAIINKCLPYGNRCVVCLCRNTGDNCTFAYANYCNPSAVCLQSYPTAVKPLGRACNTNNQCITSGQSAMNQNKGNDQSSKKNNFWLLHVKLLP